MSDPQTPTPPGDLVAAAEAGDAEAQASLGRWYGENSPETPYAQVWSLRAADQGVPRALHNLGVLAFRAGDNELAIEWFRKAVAANWTNSLFSLGTLLEEQGDLKGAVENYRQGVERDCADSMDAMARLIIDKQITNLYPHARDWSGRAVAKGHLQAHMHLATIYHEGVGVERDPKRAASLWMTAAQRGHSGAQLMIGMTCQKGIGLKEDRVAAMRFFRASAAGGHEGGQACLESLERRLTPEERTEFERDPELPANSSPLTTAPPPFLLWAAEAGDAKSQNELGSWYCENHPKSPLGLAWFQRAADEGDPRAYHNLGVEAYKAGDRPAAAEWFKKSAAGGIRRSFAPLGTILEEDGDLAGAIQLFQSGADKDCPECQSHLGRLAFEENSPDSYERARYWDEKVAAQGNAASQVRLGGMHNDGVGGEPNPEQAVHWWRQAAAQGSRAGQYLLGVAYHKGIGTKIDRLAAMRLLKASAEQGLENAAEYLPSVEAELTPQERAQLESEAAAIKH